MGYQTELDEARAIQKLAIRTAAQSLANVGALQPILIFPFPGAHLGKRPGFQLTVLDRRYWFAKLYELVTNEEIPYSLKTTYPGFSLHFIKIFYGMYYQAMQDFDARNFANVSQLWTIHFRGPPNPQGHHLPTDSMAAIEFSIRTGATSHIVGDMPIALKVAYTTWNQDPKPPFDSLREDFIVKSESVFTNAQARFYLDVNDKTFSPMRPDIGQYGAAVIQKALNIQPSLESMFQWRRTAWKQAAEALKS
jgi:hypothetical protein